MSLKKHAKHLMMLPVLAAGLSVSPFVSKGATASTPAKKKPASSSSTRKSGGKTSAKSSKRSRKQVGQKAPTTDRVSEIQQALAKDGSYSGSPNGQWDGSTVDAMRKFQSTHGLNPSGKLDAKTLQGLGLGSKTAGVAAPTVNAASRLQSSRVTLNEQQN
jgi:peptidoglycan hydrolase-like protein with peptidoglycan-binding domain